MMLLLTQMLLRPVSPAAVCQYYRCCQYHLGDDTSATTVRATFMDDNDNTTNTTDTTNITNTIKSNTSCYCYCYCYCDDVLST